jgi:hypothetical protein
MTLFTPDVNENNGRSGIIEIDSKKIVTPTYAPTKNEYVSLAKSKRVNKNDYKKAKIGELVCWLDKNQLKNLEHVGGAYNSKKAALKNDLGSIEAATKIIHFNFFDDVNTINIEQLEILLELQQDSGADVIQVPNIYQNYDYSRAIEKALEWKKGKGVEKPLMGIVCKRVDIDLLKTKLLVIESIGVNLTKFHKPLLIAVKTELKSKNVWIHGISAPVTYPKSEGTLGVLINYYGFDTISSPVANWKIAQGFGGKLAKMPDEEHLPTALKSKYFKPTDYGTPTLDKLKNQYGEGHKLSSFCTCPVCNGITIKEILDNPRAVNDNNRSHRVISSINEGDIYQNKLKNNESLDYIRSKLHAKTIIG